MAARATKALKTGMKILGGGNVPTYTLEFLTPSGSHAKGSYVTLAVPYAKLGRGGSCTVKFGEESETVSRLHAAIERKGDDVYILNLSETNPTLVNGRPVNKKYFLNNGDEIQLSLEGPRMRFNKTEAGTAKMGFTKRMNLVMQQSVKPYKTAAISFLIVFILILSGAGYTIYNLSGQLESQKLLTAARSDSLFKSLQAYKKRSDSLLALKQGGISYAKLIKPLKSKILAIVIRKFEVEFPGINKMYNVKNRLMCTGFLLEGGVFVTARHCIDRELTSNNIYNFIEHSGGEVTYYYTATSYDRKINFSFTNQQLIVDESMDAMVAKQWKHGGEVWRGQIRKPDYFHGADWAYMQTSYTGGVPYNKALSRNLKSGTKLLVLGYSYGMRYREDGNLEPYFSTAIVTLTGLQDGTIHVAEAGWDSGNSGGPVFVVDKSGKAVAIGLVTGSFQKYAQTTGEENAIIDAGIKIVTPLMNVE